jgi:hypothetical protein
MLPISQKAMYDQRGGASVQAPSSVGGNTYCSHEGPSVVCSVAIAKAILRLTVGLIFIVPFYILAKFGLYGQILFGKMTAQWIRTDRTKT